MNTIENNKLIAEFMGARFISDGMNAPDSKDIFIPFHGSCRIDTIELGKGKILKYHSSWDWLIPVVENIESLNLGDKTIETVFSEEDFYINSNVSFLITHKECYINFFGDMKVYENWISVTECDSKIKAAYTAVVKFIKWYNEQTPKP